VIAVKAIGWLLVFAVALTIGFFTVLFDLLFWLAGVAMVRGAIPMEWTATRAAWTLAKDAVAA
jgi:hypothetical protein